MQSILIKKTHEPVYFIIEAIKELKKYPIYKWMYAVIPSKGYLTKYINKSNIPTDKIAEILEKPRDIINRWRYSKDKTILIPITKEHLKKMNEYYDLENMTNYIYQREIKGRDIEHYRNR